MSRTLTTNDVLIVGAGPIGLTLANDLLRRGMSHCVPISRRCLYQLWDDAERFKATDWTDGARGLIVVLHNMVRYLYKEQQETMRSQPAHHPIEAHPLRVGKNSIALGIMQE